MATLFDDIITVLEDEKKVNPLATVSPSVLNEFFGIEEKQTQSTEAMALPETPHQTVQSASPISESDVKEKVHQNKINDVSSLDYETLKQHVMTCQLCTISKQRKSVLFGTGNCNADLMFIGGMPGYEEDAYNSLLAGRNGTILANMIKAMKFTPEQVYITNLMKCYPRTLHPDMGDVGRCLPYVKREIELVKPKVIVLFGAGPLRFLLEKSNLEACRGKWDTLMGIKTLVTYPIALIARPENKEKKRVVWEDLQLVMKELGTL